MLTTQSWITVSVGGSADRQGFLSEFQTIGSTAIPAPQRLGWLRSALHSYAG
jgi:hypothetical protein